MLYAHLGGLEHIKFCAIITEMVQMRLRGNKHGAASTYGRWHMTRSQQDLAIKNRPTMGNLPTCYRIVSLVVDSVTSAGCRSDTNCLQISLTASAANF